MWVAPDYTMPVSCCGRIFPCGAYGVGIYVRVGLQLKLASYNKVSLRGYLCNTFCSVSHCHSSSLHTTTFFYISFRAHSFRFVIFIGSEYHAFYLCGAVRPTASQCVHTFPTNPPPAIVPMLEDCVPLFFIAFICSYRHLISCCYLATVSTEIARLATNSASWPPFATVCVAAAAMLSR